MSVDLNVYCYGDRLAPVADVRELLAVAGWEIRAVDSAERMEPLDDTMLGSGLVFGWKADAKSAEAAKAAIANGDTRASTTFSRRIAWRWLRSTSIRASRQTRRSWLS
jgi:hypothetical protein